MVEGGRHKHLSIQGGVTLSSGKRGAMDAKQSRKTGPNAQPGRPKAVPVGAGGTTLGESEHS